MLLPPGITKGNYDVTSEGGEDFSWPIFETTKYYTSVFIFKDDKILLGMKKRGFGQGYYNGFGGKVEPGESSMQAALRELKEEAGVSADLSHAGVLLFTKEGVDWTFHINIYRADDFSGDITESDEMRPTWFDISSGQAVEGQVLEHARQTIPYHKMWGSDVLWLPFVISKRDFVGRTAFSADNVLLKWWFGAVPTSTSSQA